MLNTPTHLLRGRFKKLFLLSLGVLIVAILLNTCKKEIPEEYLERPAVGCSFVSSLTKKQYRVPPDSDRSPSPQTIETRLLFF